MARKTKVIDEKNEIMASEPSRVGSSQVEVDAHYRSRCGGALRTARENQGFSVPDIASRLRLSAKQIEAIEADDFAVLPEPTIVRGFIRNYAKQLKINAEPLLDAYNVLVPSATPHELIVKPSANMKMTSREKPKAGSYIWAGLLVLLGLSTWLFYQHYVQKPSPTVPSASVESVEPLPEAALPAAERTVEPQAAPQTSTELTMPLAPASPTPAVDAAANQAPPVAGTNNAVPINTQLAAPPVSTELAPVTAGKARLEFNASQETWVNVIDASGREIYSKTIFAGSRESIDVTPPVNVTVGNAGATNLSMNGKPVELAPYSRNNVAHIKLD
jgi:cytoskeleton protein RodZ